MKYLNSESINQPGIYKKARSSSAQAQDKVQGALLLDVVVRQGAAVLELLAREDEALLVRGDALLVLDLGLDVLDRVRGLDLKRDGLAGQGLHEDLHVANFWECEKLPTADNQRSK
jgi:hypothetical protein